MKEKLICAEGQHPWTRKRTRGRKPRYCPEHQPVTTVIIPPKATTAKLKVQPEPKPASAPNEVLVCEECGQTWARKRTRGRKPRLCHECRIQAQTPVPVPVVSESPAEPSEAPVAPIQKAQQAKAEKVKAKHDSLAAEVADILSHENVDPELKRKLEYCQNEIDRGRDDGLVNRRRELLREVKR